jgi:predicted nucleic acid-binding protein
MQKKRLVVDANILIRAVLGRRARELIVQYSETVAFYAADANYDEAVRYLGELAPARGIGDLVWRESLSTVMEAIQLIAVEELRHVESEAKARISRRDVNDWPAVAAAMLFDCPVWTEDSDFFGSGVPTWTSETIEIYLGK